MRRKPYVPPTITEIDPIFGVSPRPTGIDPRPPQGGSGVHEGDLLMHPRGRCTCAGDGRCAWCRGSGRGRLIAIEGIDGCGKGVVTTALAEALGGLALAFPNDSAHTGPTIRAYLRKQWACGKPTRGPELDPSIGGESLRLDDDIGALAFQALQIANRMETMPLIMRTLEAGRDVVLSRYWQSAWVYGQLDGLPRSFLELAHATMPAPDVSILLRVTPEEGMRRRAARDGAKPPELYEGSLARTRKIAESFDELWELGWTIRPDGLWRVVDASGPLDNVIAAALAVAKGEMS